MKYILIIMMFLVVGCGEDEHKSSSNANDVESVLGDRFETVNEEESPMITSDVFHFALEKLADIKPDLYVYYDHKLLNAELGGEHTIILEDLDLIEGWIKIGTEFESQRVSTVVQIDDANGLNEFFGVSE